MNKTTQSFFIGECSEVGKYAALPDRAGGRELSPKIITAVAFANESLEQATARLLRLAEHAHGQRDYAALRELADVLASLPFTPARNAGQYYAALVIKRAGDLDTAAEILSTIHAPRAIQTLGTIYKAKGELTESARLQVEALQAAQRVDPLTIINATFELSAIKSLANDHEAALADLQQIAPMVRTFARQYAHIFHQFHNELAVELAEVGNTDAARQAVAIAIASPIAQAYPEWQETATELQQAQAVAIVVAVPEQGSDEAAPEFRQSPLRNSPSPLPRQPLTDSPKWCALNPRAGPRAPPVASSCRQ